MFGFATSGKSVGDRGIADNIITSGFADVLFSFDSSYIV
jgi:hypothetical protein